MPGEEQGTGADGAGGEVEEWGVFAVWGEDRGGSGTVLRSLHGRGEEDADGGEGKPKAAGEVRAVRE
ncbi:MAG: hypothetical protein KGI72_06090 [Patescibacteria group bacterium]|nr:hypothetical protein [Patescibacteria group bacterium]